LRARRATSCRPSTSVGLVTAINNLDDAVENIKLRRLRNTARYCIWQEWIKTAELRE
jgi:hypothetical protein